MIEELSRAAHRLDRALSSIPTWVWPACMVLLAAATWAASLLLVPRDEHAAFRGAPIGGTCAFLAETGQPCPNCGMTRAFLWSARLSLARGLAYNPAGALLFWWITVGGILGVVRLATRDPRRLAPPWQGFVAWSGLWIAIYLVTWFLRLGGINPLP